MHNGRSSVPTSLILPLACQTFPVAGASAPKVAHIASVEAVKFSKFGHIGNVVY